MLVRQPLLSLSLFVTAALGFGTTLADPAVVLATTNTTFGGETSTDVLQAGNTRVGRSPDNGCGTQNCRVICKGGDPGPCTTASAGCKVNDEGDCVLDVQQPSLCDGCSCESNASCSMPSTNAGQ